MEKQLLRIEEVAETLGISRAQVYRLLGAGTEAGSLGDPVHIGRSVRVRAESVRRFVDDLQHKTEPADVA